jgi:hypothetical protein
MISLPSGEETGALGLRHLKRFWARTAAGGNTSAPHSDAAADWPSDNTLLCGLRVGLRETVAHVLEYNPTFAEFEAWIREKNQGHIDPHRIAALNIALSGGAPPCDPLPPALTADDLAFWEENG